MEEQKAGEITVQYQTLIVDKGQSPMRVDHFLINRLENVTRNKLQNAMKEGRVLVNEVAVKPNYKIKPLDVIRFDLQYKSDFGELLPEDIPLNIVYEDADVLIINKDHGMVVHPGISNASGTLVNAITHYLSTDNLPVLPGNSKDRAGLVHRIDKNTTGLIVIAKNDESLTFLAKQFLDHTIQRTYIALVWGNFEEKSGTIRGHIDRHPKNRRLRAVFPDGSKGKHAVTHYEVIEDLYYVSLIKCRLETGRTHQIRVHMAHQGHPLFNDETYGGDEIIKGTVFTKYKQFVKNCFHMMPRHALHATSLGFVHPRTGENMYFECPLPDDFTALVDKWRNYLIYRKNVMDNDE